MPTIQERFCTALARLEARLGEPLTIDGVAGPYRIFQRTKGQRHSLDDAITGWYACQKAPTAKRILDLGCGVGTVGLNLMWGLGADSSMVAIEAQEISFTLLAANILANDLALRVTPMHADIREVTLNEQFELVTGSPPYFPINAGVLPPDSQKAHARFELRGHIGDYARVAKRHLQPDGLFVFCFPFQQKERCLTLVKTEGFKIATIRDVVPRLGKPALFSLYSARLQETAPTAIEDPFVVADDCGRYTDEMIAMQRSRGFGPDGTNTLS